MAPRHADKIFTAKQADFNDDCPFFCNGYGIDHGDSGGPVNYDQGLFGIVATTNGKWSLARNVEVDLGVWFCMNGSCTLP